MTDLFGAQALPITASVGAATTVTVSAADPLLSYLASYLKTAANARLGAAWAALAPNAGPVPVAQAFEHDPEQWEFNDKYLPALFLFRNGDAGGAVEQLASDWLVTNESISLLWVLPSGPQEKLAVRGRFVSKLFHLFLALVNANRDKAWLVNGDAEALALQEGSSLATFGKFMRLRQTRGAVRKPFSIQMRDGGKPMGPYPAYEAIYEVRERFVADTANNPLLDGIDGTIHTTDQGFLDGGKVLGVLKLDT